MAKIIKCILPFFNLIKIWFTLLLSDDHWELSVNWVGARCVVWFTVSISITRSHSNTGSTSERWHHKALPSTEQHADVYIHADTHTCIHTQSLHWGFKVLWHLFLRFKESNFDLAVSIHVSWHSINTCSKDEYSQVISKYTLNNNCCYYLNNKKTIHEVSVVSILQSNYMNTLLSSVLYCLCRQKNNILRE